MRGAAEEFLTKVPSMPAVLPSPIIKAPATIIFRKDRREILSACKSTASEGKLSHVMIFFRLVTSRYNIFI